MTNTGLIPREVPIVGNRDEVMSSLVRQMELGRMRTPLRDLRLYHRPDGKVETTVVLMVPAPYRREDAFAQVMKALAFAVLILAVSGGIVWAVVAAVGPQTILAAIVLFALFGIAVVFNRASHRGACPGVIVHCRGCKH